MPRKKSVGVVPPTAKEQALQQVYGGVWFGIVCFLAVVVNQGVALLVGWASRWAGLALGLSLGFCLCTKFLTNCRANFHYCILDCRT